MKNYKYDESYLPELIRASLAFNEIQKSYLLEKLPKFSQEKKIALFDLLAREQFTLYGFNKQRIFLNNDYLAKKTKILNSYNEKLEDINNHNILRQLDDQFDAVFH